MTRIIKSAPDQALLTPRLSDWERERMRPREWARDIPTRRFERAVAKAIGILLLVGSAYFAAQYLRAWWFS